MIIWINGAFGSGKTQTAYELHRRLEHSFVFDPEKTGYFIRKNLPASSKVEDFQDYPLWRNFTGSMLQYMSSTFDGIIIVPMTITNPIYYQEIIEQLDNVRVNHYIIYASKTELLRRLQSRGTSKTSWAAQQIDRCLAAFDQEITETIIHNDDKSISWTVEEIARQSGLTLLPDTRSAWKKSMDRLLVKIKHR
ncbi:AAA family ATPase [Brevibacillus daliensis]|uniref:AAA family ATPase n=1 Tax=Brevibacillus daliensis TaxID=2892995 RepID=UPI001E372E61|nr:AAA family ATPase [Brevibacillus daliensis]